MKNFLRILRCALSYRNRLVLSLACSLSLGAWGAASGIEIFPGKSGLLSNLDYLASNWLLPVGGFFITLAAGWAMSRETTEAELLDARAPRWFSYGVWRFTLRFVAPAAVGAIIAAVIFLKKDFS